MRKKLILCLYCIIHATCTYATNYYVATNGNNIANGLTLATPFLTIQKAADVAQSGDIVYVRAGVYREGVDLKADGVSYQPYNNEVVTINGTNLLFGWTLTTGTTYQTTMDWDLNGNFGTNQLFSDGKMIELARWPDQTSADIIMPTTAIVDAVTVSGTNFTFTDAAFSEPNGRWVGAQIWVNLSNHQNDGQGWTGTVTATNQAAHTITVNFGDTPRLGAQPWGLNNKTEYFLFNPTLDGVNTTGGVNALLSNGEWWKNGNTLYIKTPNGTAPSELVSGTNVIEAKQRYFGFFATTTKANYTIKNFNLFACAIITDINAFTNRTIIEDAHDIVIDGIKAKYVSHQTNFAGNWQNQHYAWSGFVISGRNNIIRKCSLEFSATSALSVSGFGNKVLNNTITNTNYMCSNSGAVNTGFIAQDFEIANNTISNTTIMAINFKYGQNSNVNNRYQFRIHHNTIFNYLRRSGDSGAIDAVTQDAQWIRIDHNHIFNTIPISGSSMNHGIYIDFGGGSSLETARYTFDHNIITDIPVPIIINNCRFVNIFYNVLLSNISEYCITNSNNGTNINPKNGGDVIIRNNIMSKGPNNDDCCYGVTLNNAVVNNNITNAFGTTLTNLFVDAANRNYNLKSSATAAINTGVNVGVYDGDLVGLPDLGAFEYQQNIALPTAIITSNAASSLNEPAPQGFDGNNATNWSQPTNTGWWQIQYSYPVNYNFYSIVSSANSNRASDLKSWTIQASNNLSDWLVLDTRTNQTWATANTAKDFAFTNGNLYTYYRLVFTANNGNSFTQVAEIALSAKADLDAPSIPTGLNATLVTPFTFTLNWPASVDNVNTTLYEIYKDGVFLASTTNTSYKLNNLLGGTTYAITIRAYDFAGNVSLFSQPLSVTTSTSLTTGTVNLETWRNRSGRLISQIPVTRTPSSVRVISKLDIPSTGLNAFGVRVRGYIIPSTSGQYFFYIASDDQGELRLSTNYLPANVVKIAQVDDYTNALEFEKYVIQQSSGKNLKAGQKYYFEALMKQDSGGDHLSVGWAGPGLNGIEVIGSANLDMYIEPALPVTLTNFTGKTTQAGNQLKWTTQSETHNKGFAILKSVDDGKSFNEIGFVPSQSISGNSSQIFNYTFLDVDVNATAFYKLQQTDLNGLTSLSDIVFLQSDFVIESNIYPNPFEDEINVSLNVKNNSLLTFSLVNANGKLVYSKMQKAQKNTRFGLKNLPIGWYILTVNNANGKVLFTKKVLKK